MLRYAITSLLVLRLLQRDMIKNMNFKYSTDYV